MATHSSILVWRIPWTKEPGGQFVGLQRIGHNWASNIYLLSLHIRIRLTILLNVANITGGNNISFSSILHFPNYKKIFFFIFFCSILDSLFASYLSICRSFSYTGKNWLSVTYVMFSPNILILIMVSFAFQKLKYIVQSAYFSYLLKHLGFLTWFIFIFYIFIEI